MLNFVDDGVTFDDVLVVPASSTISSSEVDTRTNFSKNIKLNIPLVSAGMNTVTESRMAISMARQGGIGTIHANMSIEQQVSEVDTVKRSEYGVITDPFFLSPNAYVYEADNLMRKYHISGVPITEHGILVGIITNRDLRFEVNHKKKIYEVMTRENLLTAPVGTTLESAKAILSKSKVEKLPIVDEKGYLKGLVTTKDIQKQIKYPNSAKDAQGRLLVAAVVSFDNPDYKERVEALHKVGVDAIVTENCHDLNKIVNGLKWIKENFPSLDVVAGSIVSAKAAKKLIDAGADAIKVGIGSGSTSTIRVISGVGVPQLTAVNDVYSVCREYDVPVVNDGGTKFSGDIVKALAGGASTIILGSLIAGTDEAPSIIELFEGRKYKAYKGISSSSTNPDVVNEVVADGIDARVPYKGKLSDITDQLLVGVRLGMSYAGAPNIKTLQETAQFVKITQAGNREGHPHSVKVTRDSAGYSFEHFNSLFK